MSRILNLAKRKLTSDLFDVRVGQIVLFAGVLLLFGCVVLKLPGLHLDQGQLLIVLLSAIACMLLLILIGLVLPLSVAAAAGNVKQ